MQNEQHPFPIQYVPAVHGQPQSQDAPQMQPWGAQYATPGSFNLQQQQQQQQPWQVAPPQPANFQAPELQQQFVPQVPLEPGGLAVEQGGVGDQGQWYPSAQQPQPMQYPGRQPNEPYPPANLQPGDQQAPHPNPGHPDSQPHLAAVGHGVPHFAHGQDSTAARQGLGSPQAAARGYNAPHDNALAQEQMPQVAILPSAPAQPQGAAAEYSNQVLTKPEEPAQLKGKHKGRRRHHGRPAEAKVPSGFLGFAKGTFHAWQERPYLHEDTAARLDYLQRLDTVVNHTPVGKLLPVGSTMRGELKQEAARVGAVVAGKPAHEVDWSGVADGEDRKRRHERRLAKEASKKTAK